MSHFRANASGRGYRTPKFWTDISKSGNQAWLSYFGWSPRMAFWKEKIINENMRTIELPAILRMGGHSDKRPLNCITSCGNDSMSPVWYYVTHFCRFSCLMSWPFFIVGQLLHTVAFIFWPFTPTCHMLVLGYIFLWVREHLLHMYLATLRNWFCGAVKVYMCSVWRLVYHW